MVQLLSACYFSNNFRRRLFRIAELRWISIQNKHTSMQVGAIGEIFILSIEFGAKTSVFVFGETFSIFHDMEIKWKLLKNQKSVLISWWSFFYLRNAHRKLWSFFTLTLLWCTKIWKSDLAMFSYSSGIVEDTFKAGFGNGCWRTGSDGRWEAPGDKVFCWRDVPIRSSGIIW